MWNAEWDQYDDLAEAKILFVKLTVFCQHWTQGVPWFLFCVVLCFIHFNLYPEISAQHFQQFRSTSKKKKKQHPHTKKKTAPQTIIQK